MSIEITKAVYDAMVAHAQEITPIESCGYLAGTGSKITTFYPMTNIDQSPEHFTFDPKEQFKVLKESRAAGLQLLSVYHSHPESPARLSLEDLRLLQDPEMIYIIVSLATETADVKAFKTKEGQGYPVDIHIN